VSASTTSAEFFEGKYRRHADPWNFARSEYEQARYAAILAALDSCAANGVPTASMSDSRQYERAFEPGCSVGELTVRLAQRCSHVVAMDISPTAVEIAKQRCSECSNIEFHVGALPELPEGMYDLIVFSEIGYYFDEAGLQALGNALVSRLRPSGILLAAHWLGHSKDHVLSGDRVHKILEGLHGLRSGHEERHTGFRLQRWIRL
jgi:SAM-dependent methyltransferase